MAAYHSKKRLGQNFLKSEAIIEQVIQLVAPTAGETIVEIGSGRGALTLPLAKTGAQVYAIEFDRDLIPYLTALLDKYPDVMIRHQDFLTFDPSDDNLTKFKLVGNLPYNLTSPVIDWCLARRAFVSEAVFMVQKELGARLAAVPGGKNWSPLSIMAQVFYQVAYCFEVAPEHFQPAPEVMSAVVKLTLRPEPAPVNIDRLARLVRASFKQRRKQLVNNLVPQVLPDSKAAVALFEQLSLPRKVRAEEVTLEQFLKLTELVGDTNVT